MLQHQDPVGSGLASDAIVEAAGPDCIVPGQIKPVRLLGLKVFFLSFFSDYGILSLLNLWINSALHDCCWQSCSCIAFKPMRFCLMVFWGKKKYTTIANRLFLLLCLEQIKHKFIFCLLNFHYIWYSFVYMTCIIRVLTCMHIQRFQMQCFHSLEFRTEHTDIVRTLP